MKEQIIQIIQYISPLIAGLMTSIIIPLITNLKTTKYLKIKIDEVHEGKVLQDIKEETNCLRKEIAELKKEIFELRGKTK